MARLAERLVGKVINGKYRVTRLLGEGGMGVVMEGIVIASGESCAMKFMLTPGTSPSALDRFMREWKVVAGLQHPAIVRVIGEVEQYEELVFLVMELLKGASLGDRVKATGKMSWAEAFAIGLQAIEPLHYAHMKGIIHRDIKPDNLFVTSQGVVKVVDFGIAKVTENASRALTPEHSVLGTPVYMSREQASGQKVDARADVYSLGALLYYLISGEFPYGQQSPDDQTGYIYLAKIIRETPTDILVHVPELPPMVAEVFRRALAPEKDDRFINMEVFAQAMRECLAPVAKSDPENPTFKAYPQTTKLLAAPRPPTEAIPQEVLSETSSRRVEASAPSPAPRSSVLVIAVAFGLFVGASGAVLAFLRAGSGAKGPVTAIADAAEALPPPAAPVANLPDLATLHVPDMATSTVKPAPQVVDAAAPALGKLSVRSFPLASVRVDGKAVGDTPLQNYSLRPGRHTVELIANDGRRETRTISIQPGQSESLKVRFP